MGEPGQRRLSVVPGALLAVAATAVVYAPQLVIDAGDMSRIPLPVIVVWLFMLLAAAPSVAALKNRRAPAATTGVRALAVGVPQLPAAVGLVALDVWLEVRSGYLLAGSGEEAMAYGIGMLLGVIGGLVLALLVAGAAYVASSNARAADLAASGRGSPSDGPAGPGRS